MAAAAIIGSLKNAQGKKGEIMKKKMPWPDSNSRQTD